MKKTGFGVVGAGMIAGIHADALRKSEKAELIAIYDIFPEAARKLAEQHAPNARICASFDEMLQDPGIEVISVATPNQLHTDYVLQATAAGKHVLCEKPPAMSLAETDCMIAASREAGVKFGIFVQSRFRPPMRAIKYAIDQGRFGRVLRIETIMKWYRGPEYYQLAAWRSDVRCGAGVTIQQAFHYYDLMQYLAGPALRVNARMSNIGHPGVALEDTLEAQIDFADGVRGALFASTALWPGTDVRIEMYGTEGCAIMEGAAMKTWTFKDERPEDESIRQAGDPGQATAGSSYSALPSEDHLFVIDDCVDAILDNREVCIPCHSVRPTLEIALAMYASARREKEITLPLPVDDDCWRPEGM